jgi:transposase InsO family protein
MVHNYHSDNGIFAAQAFVKQIEENFQSIRFRGPYAHHQNGAAERSIGTLFNSDRTMLLHAKLRWPEVIDIDIWSMAIEYARWIYNYMPNDAGISPIDLLTKNRTNRNVLSNAHVFGCHVYVLDPKLQEGRAIPKFKPRS